jgi:hypothetical protein
MFLRDLLCFSAIFAILICSSCKKTNPPAGQTEQILHTVASFSPLSGTEGTEVTITGMNFSTNTTSHIVKFNGIIATISRTTATQLIATVPPGATTGKISVTMNGVVAESTEQFIVKNLVKKHLKKILISEPDSENINVIWEWQYDGLNRVSEATTTNQNPTLSVRSRVRFYYNANDTKPYFIQSLPQVASENVGLDTHITYDEQGRKTSDSSVQIHLVCGKVQHLAQYHYGNDMLYVQYTSKKIDPYISTPVPNIAMNYDTIFLGSGNVTKVAQKGSQNISFKNSLSYVYDDKVNPFRNLNVFSSFYTLGFDVGSNYWSSWGVPADALYIIGLNKNNVINIQMNNSYSQQFTYIYDTDNYPASATITTNSGVSTYVIKIRYEYFP